MTNTTPLSLAAKAVLDVALDRWLDVETDSAALIAAAALRAVADQIEDLYCESDLDDSEGVVFALRHLCLIADEIETL